MSDVGFIDTLSPWEKGFARAAGRCAG